MAQVHKLPPQCHLPRAAPCPAQRPGRQGLGPSAGHPTGTANLAGVDARLKGAMGIRGYQWISIGDINFGSFGLREDLVAIRIAIRPPQKLMNYLMFQSFSRMGVYQNQDLLGYNGM